MFFPFFLSAFERQGRNKGNLHRGLLGTKKNDGISNGKMFLYAELCRRGRKKKQDAETNLSMVGACFFWGENVVMTKEARERSENGRSVAVRKVSGKG